MEKYFGYIYIYILQIVQNMCQSGSFMHSGGMHDAEENQRPPKMFLIPCHLKMQADRIAICSAKTLTPPAATKVTQSRHYLPEL